MAWLRLYEDILDDPKVMLLPPDVFRTWVLFLCASKARDGILPNSRQLAYRVRLDDDTCVKHLDLLVEAGLIDDTDEGMMMHAWDKRQYVNDISTSRVNKYRETRAKAGLTPTGYQKHRKAVLDRDGHACRYCGSTDKLVLDHLLPVGRGGDDSIDNLITACKSCNAKKRDRLPEECGMSLASLPVSRDMSRTVTPVTKHVTPVTGIVTPVTPVTTRVDTESETDTESESELDALEPQQLFSDLAKDICQRLPLGGDPQLTLTCLQHEYRNSASFLGRPTAFAQSISRRLTLWADAYRADPFLARQAKAGQWWLKNGIYALDPPSGGHTQTGKKSLTQLALEHLAAKENNHAH